VILGTTWRSGLDHFTPVQQNRSSGAIKCVLELVSRWTDARLHPEARFRLKASITERGDMHRFRLRFLLGLLPILLFFPSACLPNKKISVTSTALLLEDVAGSACRQSDLQIIRRGMPAYLMLIDGMLTSCPNDERLLLAAARSYSSYASAFIQDRDAESADRLYAKATTYALKALAVIAYIPWLSLALLE
jgi:hypothetical protein